MNKSVLIIAEAGVNHNGDIQLAYKLCDEAKKAGADVVKFQTYKTEKIITHNVKQADYQKKNTKSDVDQYEMLKKLELTYDEFAKVKAYCDSIGIVFASTADEEDGLDFLMSLDMPFIKIGSDGLTNVPFLRKVACKKKPIILSTGMSTLDDIDLSLRTLREYGASDITLLHCTSNYPCAFENVNLNAMKTIQDKFGLPVGYSDHTLGSTVSVAAVAMGAVVIEKHFTLDKNMEGPDHIASLEPRELQQFVKDIRNVCIALGNGNKCLSDDEKRNAEVMQKRIVAKRSIKKGQIITEEDVCAKRNEIGLMAKNWDLIINSVAKRDYYVDEGIVL